MAKRRATVKKKKTARRRPTQPKSPAAATPRTKVQSAAVSERIDDDLAKAALVKQQAGEHPNRQEQAALRRVEAKHAESQRWQAFTTITKNEWAEMSGRQPKVINEQATRYGIPFDGKRISGRHVVINLPDVVRAYHDFLAKNAHRLSGNGEADPMLNGTVTPALEQYRQQKAELARLDVAERKQETIKRDDVHEGLNRLASILRGAGAQLQKSFGPDAQSILDAALDDFDREMSRRFGIGGSD